MTLDELKPGYSGIVVKVRGRETFYKRLTEMGFIRGHKVEVIRKAPFGDPMEYRLMGYEISLRRKEAALIEVIPSNENTGYSDNLYHGTIDEKELKISAQKQGQIIEVAFVGNPNSGKTSLFNLASGAKEKVANYSGVTVDSKTAVFKYDGYQFNITDLPGTYSLSAYSYEELFVRKFIFEKKPDIIVNVLDASNLERNLYLTTQLIDMDAKVVIALNMYDEMQERGDNFNHQLLSQLIGIPIIPTVAIKKNGIKELFKKIIDVYENQDPVVRHVHIHYGDPVEKSIAVLQQRIRNSKSFIETVAARFYAIKLIERDAEIIRETEEWEDHLDLHEIANKEIHELESFYDEPSDVIVSDARYGFIVGALKETYHPNYNFASNKTQKIDTILTHKIWGFPLFLLFLTLMFFTTFTFGKFPKEWMDLGIQYLGAFARNSMPDSGWTDLLVDGIIGGVGGVIVFLPNILTLFFFISLMEDTGYMARVAFLMDKLMHRIGLHGKSFIPMIMGFGCNVPAVMATRTLENRGDRLLTMLTIPFMSCSARLPAYILFLGLFFPKFDWLIMIALYLFGIILSILFAWIFKRFIFKTQEIPFVMELPPYRIPTTKAVFLNMWFKAKYYLKKMGGIILFASILIWVLAHFPKNRERQDFYTSERQNIEHTYQQDSIRKTQLMTDINRMEKAEQLQQSILGSIGKFIEPAIQPLGFEWKTGVALLSGITAKEVLVSTLGVMYQLENADEKSPELKDKIASDTYTDGVKAGEKVFTPLVSLSLLIFILVYFPCLSVFIVVGKESGKWKYSVFLALYSTALAWLLSFIVYQAGSLF